MQWRSEDATLSIVVKSWKVCSTARRSVFATACFFGILAVAKNLKIAVN